MRAMNLKDTKSYIISKIFVDTELIGDKVQFDQVTLMTPLEHIDG